jgi:MFS family permease
MSNPRAPWQIIAILAVTQVVAWGSLYYAIAILAPEIGREMGWRAEIVFGAFSWCLLVAGAASTPAGILIDRHGGRSVMAAGSLLCGAGFLLLGSAHTIAVYFLAWTVLGLAMSAILYEGAFATINREFTGNARKGISMLTLFGGFASTVFWPLTLKLNGVLGWRDTYLLYGALQLLLCAPLHALLSARARSAPVVAAQGAQRNFTLREALRDATFWKLAVAFSANSFIFSALSVHLIPLFKQFGHPIELAVMMAALIGPMQVAGRIGEMTLGRHSSPTSIGKATFSALPAGLLALLLFGQHQSALGAFCILYGLSNGILTIVRGTIPQVLFGREHYGAISGALSASSLISKAAGPLAIAALVQHTPSPTPLLAVLLAFSLVSLGFYLAAIRTPRRAGDSLTSRA